MIIIPVFISHSWSYSDHYETLADWLFTEVWGVEGGVHARVHFSDCSVPKDDPIHSAPTIQSLQAAIFGRIANAGVVVIPTGMYASYSAWIEKEIVGANTYRKPILAVDPWGAQRTSSIVQRNAAETVGWRKQSVADGIWRLAQPRFQNSRF